MNILLPRVLIIDDRFGRTLSGRRNKDRAALCGRFHLEDVTNDEQGKGTPQQIAQPLAQAVFCRGQTPVCAGVGDEVRNEITETLRVVRSGWQDCPPQDRWALLLLDLCFYTGLVTADSSEQEGEGMPEGRSGDNDAKQYFGLRLLEAIRKEFPDLPVVILSSMPRGEVSREFTIKGAVDFLDRTNDDAEKLARVLRQCGLIADHRGVLLGWSVPFLKALKDARRAAMTGKANILVRGEAGTGKEFFARYIHDTSPRQASVFRATFPAGVAESIVEDYLFGHEKGAFTGATGSKAGEVELADGGTLFIDECGEIAPTIRPKLLRLLDPETREVQRQGSTQPVRLDLQVVLATSRAVEAGEPVGGFREDLMRRITNIVVVPPLRERLDDLPLLVEHFTRRAVAACGATPRDVFPETLQVLREHSWPGNIGELEQTIKRAVEHFPGLEHLAPQHIEFQQRYTPIVPTARTAAPSAAPPIDGLDGVIALLKNFTVGKDLQALAGRWPQLRAAFAILAGRYLNAALEVTRKSTTLDIVPQAACRLITGDAMKGTAIADLINQICSYDPDAIQDLLISDTALAQASKAKAKRRLNRGVLAKRLVRCLAQLPSAERGLLRQADETLDDVVNRGPTALTNDVAAKVIDCFLDLPAEFQDTLVAAIPRLRTILAEAKELPKKRRPAS
jgi:DNA-binding NtrC family response regulator